MNAMRSPRPATTLDVVAEVVELASLPRHAQIRETIRRRILDGSYAPHSQMASESQMMAAFGVSRITIRQALGDLQKEGLIFKVTGKGSFVAKPKAFQNLSRLQGFGEAMGHSGYETFNQLLSLKTVAAPELVARRLQLEAGAAVCEIQRLRYLNREPISVDVSYFPPELGRRLAEEDLAARDIFAIIENDYGHQLTHADVQIEAISADETLSRHLRVPESAPLLRIERLTHSDEGPIDFEFLFYRGDAFQYRLRIERS
jgi:GntR family transcriptional regulator